MSFERTAEERMTTTKTMAFKNCGSVLLCVHGDEDPQPVEWLAYVNYCLELPASCNKALVVTDGGGPNAAQRKLLQDRYLARHREYRVAVTTDSTVVRRIVKALHWFNPHTQSFAYDDGGGVAAAIAHLGVDIRTGARVRLELDVLRGVIAADNVPGAGRRRGVGS
jgi:hypothetical protein